MPGEFTHIEIPADETGEAREFYGSLFGWEFNAVPGPSEYHMAHIGDRQGAGTGGGRGGARCRRSRG